MNPLQPLRRLQRPASAWLALLLCMAALLPSLSHAFGRQTAMQWAELCTAQGMKWVMVDASSVPANLKSPASANPELAQEGAPKAPGSGVSLHGSLDHCPYCAFACAAAGLPPAEPLPWAAPQALRSQAPLYWHAPHRLHAWVAAAPRGPPLST